MSVILIIFGHWNVYWCLSLKRFILFASAVGWAIEGVRIVRPWRRSSQDEIYVSRETDGPDRHERAEPRSGQTHGVLGSGGEISIIYLFFSPGIAQDT